MTKEAIKFLWDLLEFKNLSEGSQKIVRNLLNLDTLDVNESPVIFKNTAVELKPCENNNQYVDYRMTNMMLQGFRNYPEASIPFGLNTSDEKGQPCSLILIGSNGTGKSTLFSAIETYYTGLSSLAQERHVKLDKFISHAFLPDNKNIYDRLTANIVGLENRETERNLATPSSFCSNYDIQKLEESDDLADYIFIQLGYSDILVIEDMLDVELKRSEELINRSEKVEEELSSTLEEVINAYIELALGRSKKEDNQERYKDPTSIERIAHQLTSSDVEKKFFKADWVQLLSLREDDHDSPDISMVSVPHPKDSLNEEYFTSISELSKKYKLLYTYFKRRSSVEDKKKNLEELYQRYFKAKAQETDELMTNEMRSLRNEEMRQRVKDINELKGRIRLSKESILSDFIKDSKQFVEKVLISFSEFDTFELIADNGAFVRIDAKDHQGKSFLAKPNEYLNSFRFVLYSVSLKLALAFWQMKRNKMITPIVIDDVFDASDFENSQKLEKFVYEIFRAYAIMAKEESINIPLQLIVLTHDQLMKTSFERGIIRYKIESTIKERGLMEAASCVCGRLLPLKDIEKASEDELIGHFGNFKNLYIRL